MLNFFSLKRCMSKIETVRVFVAQKKKTIDRETTYGENFIFLRTRYSCEVSRGKLPTSMRYFGNEKIKKKKKRHFSW